MTPKSDKVDKEEVLHVEHFRYGAGNGKQIDVKYRILKSDSDDWFILDLPDYNIKVDIEKRVLNFRYDCVPHEVNVLGEKVSCSRFCCYTGCYISPVEIDFVNNILDDLKPYLSSDSLDVLERYQDEIYLPETYDPDEDLYKTRCAPFEPDEEGEVVDDCEDEEGDDGEEEGDDGEEEGDDGEEEGDDGEEEGEILTLENNIIDIPVTHCIFLMDNGLCAIHKYCVDHNLDWHLNKFSICVTFPLDIRVTNNGTSDGAPFPKEKRVDDDFSTIKMMEEYENFLYHKMDCLHLSPNVKERLGVPYVLDSMKYAFESRFGEIFWAALKDYAKKYGFLKSE
ncbi:MAG: hypothetical protein ACTSU2_13440 [Promethearchaeota archaeon]